MIKLDIINEVVNRTGISKAKAEEAVESVFAGMKRALERGDRIELRGFGVFNVRPRKTGIGRNPRTGAQVNIAPGKAIRFKPGKDLQSIERKIIPDGGMVQAPFRLMMEGRTESLSSCHAASIASFFSGTWERIRS